MTDETELKRLFWHSRRGMLELDVLLVPFVQEVYPGLPADDQARFRKLLEFFFQIHDPSTPGRQGNDRGSSYRSAIFYTSDEQLATAQQTIADVNASGLWPGKVVTELAPAGPFWEAEPEHQDYLERIPNGYTCHFARPGWVLPKRAAA